ncbi:MAG: flagellar hook capping protein [Sphingomonadaceae bacterium]|nr:flagellar hook capping protein [Sphingomonadaceae bacterium]
MTTVNTSIDYLRSASAAGSTTGTTSGTTSGTSGSSGTLGMSDFLTLLTTQMQTQDPFNPVDNTQMVAQMAQFSSVAGISSMNTTLSQIASNLDGSRIGDAASWIGKSVLSSGATASALSDGSYAGQITLPSNAADMKVSFIDANGTIVHSEDAGAQSAGAVNFAWDGKDTSGNAVAGPVTVQASATDANGKAITPSIATWAEVEGVQSPAGGSSAQLITSSGLVSPTAVLSLS